MKTIGIFLFSILILGIVCQEANIIQEKEQTIVEPKAEDKLVEQKPKEEEKAKEDENPKEEEKPAEKEEKPATEEEKPVTEDKPAEEIKEKLPQITDDDEILGNDNDEPAGIFGYLTIIVFAGILYIAYIIREKNRKYDFLNHNLEMGYSLLEEKDN